MTSIPPEHPALDYTDCIARELVAAEHDPAAKVLRFNRRCALEGKGYGWDNPGARIRWRTAASTVTALLVYSTRHSAASAHNSIGAFYIDGQTRDNWVFQPAGNPAAAPVRPARLEVSLPAPGDGKAHTYELILPYGDSVDFAGLRLGGDATLTPPPSRPKIRCLMYGDSVTHGFTASEIRKTYAFAFCEKKDWQVLNIAIGGQSSNPANGKLLAEFAAELLTVLIGVNDWQSGVPPLTFQKNLEGTIRNLRSKRPDTPVYLITPLWVPQSWQPATARYPLEDYRQAARVFAETSRDANLHLIDGSALIDHNPALFDIVAVHPNDAGFQQMAGRLSKLICLAPAP